MNDRDSISSVIHYHRFITLMNHRIEDMRMLQLEPKKQFGWVSIENTTDLIRLHDIRNALIKVFTHRYYSNEQYHKNLKGCYLPQWTMKHFGIINYVKHYRYYKKADRIIEFLYGEYLKMIRDSGKEFDKHGITPWERMMAEELGHE